LKNNSREFVNRNLDKELKKAKLLEARFLLGQIIAKKITDIIITRS